MPFIGNKPAQVPLTSADIADGIITSAKIVDGTIVNADINASAGVVFTKLASTGTLTVDNIQFPATAVASANANNLDDYEEGTWTPVINSGFNAGVTYAAQGGTYTKIGNRVFFTCRLEIGTGTGNGNRIDIGGLPFSSLTSPSGGFSGAAVFSYVNSNIINSTSTNPPTMYIGDNSTGINFYKTNGDNFLGTDLSVPTNADFYLTGYYVTS
jgi:hypothetical protein